jgi:hypothetical protein
MNYVMRHGRRIEVETINMPEVEKKKRKRWAARWVKLPRHWITALRNTRSARSAVDAAGRRPASAISGDRLDGELPVVSLGQCCGSMALP